MFYPFHMMGNPNAPATYRGGVECSKCGAKHPATTPPDEAIAAWNTRVPVDDAPAYARGMEDAAKLCDAHHTRTKGTPEAVPVTQWGASECARRIRLVVAEAQGRNLK